MKIRRIKKAIHLKEKVDPSIYYHVKTLNRLGVKTEYSCAAIGKSITDCGKIIIKEDHGDTSNFPHVLTTKNLDNKCQLILGLILFNSPEVLYCKKSKSFSTVDGSVFGKSCFCNFQTDTSGDSIYENHKFFRLIDVYNVSYGRKEISLWEQETPMPLG